VKLEEDEERVVRGKGEVKEVRGKWNICQRRGSYLKTLKGVDSLIF